jgi:GT2 family glycosyltransferase
MAPVLSILIVTYNSQHQIHRSLESLYRQTGLPSFEVIVVDNASADNTVSIIRKHFPQVRIVQSNRNLGFAGGLHAGIGDAQGKYLLLMNPDTVVLNSAIDRLLNFAGQNPQNGIWGGITLYDNMALNPEHAWTKPTFIALLFFAFGFNKLFPHSPFFNKINYGGWRRDAVKKVDIISGCFFLTTRELWDRLDGFDPAFFLYAEEADFCLRAKKIGCQPIVTPDAKVIHHGGASHDQFSEKMVLLLKGKIELIQRHVEAWKRPFYKFLLLLYVFNNCAGHFLLKPISPKYSDWRIVFKKRCDWLKGYRS